MNDLSIENMVIAWVEEVDKAVSLNNQSMPLILKKAAVGATALVTSKLPHSDGNEVRIAAACTSLLMAMYHNAYKFGYIQGLKEATTPLNSRKN